jgi:hypothetical protein
MARTIHYKIIDESTSIITDKEWEEISRLQHWYNSEFIWTAGRLALKMYAVFSNWDKYQGDTKKLLQTISSRRRELKRRGLTENAIIEQLVGDGYVIAKKGGYSDNCLASGFTKVAGNEFNAYLVCEFLLKASMIARNAAWTVFDEGNFIKTHRVRIRDGIVYVPTDGEEERRAEYYIREHKIFSIVNPQKYDNFPKFRTLVAGFNELDEEEKQEILRDWNWLGFSECYDINGDDIQGFDLNRKVRKVEIISTIRGNSPNY